MVPLKEHFPFLGIWILLFSYSISYCKGLFCYKSKNSKLKKMLYFLRWLAPHRYLTNILSEHATFILISYFKAKFIMIISTDHEKDPLKQHALKWKKFVHFSSLYKCLILEFFSICHGFKAINHQEHLINVAKVLQKVHICGILEFTWSN